MPSTNAPPANSMQKRQPKQPARRVVPVIPRQLTRPRRQISEVKQEAVMKAAQGEKSLSPKMEPATEAAGEQQAFAHQSTAGDAVKAEEKNGHVNGHRVNDAAAASSIEKAEQPLSPEIGAEQTHEQATLEQVKQEQVKPDQVEPDQPEQEGIEQDTQPCRARQGRPDPDIKPSQTKQERGSEEIKASKTFKPARASLPPPFVPSRELHRFPSPAPSIAPATATFPFTAHHTAHPSVEGLMFGGYRDSANISPESMQMSASPHPQPFMNGAPVPIQATVTSHFAPDAYPHPHPYNNVTPSHNPNLDYAASMNAQSMPFTRPQTNGASYMSRTPSQASSVVIDPSLGHHSNSGIMTPEASAHYYPREPAYDPRQGVRPPQQPNSGVPTPAMQQAPSQAEMSNMQAMRQYFSERFGSYDFADYILDLAVNRSLPVHSVLLARSAGMRRIMNRARKGDASHHWRLRISTEEYYKEPDAFVEAVRYLYGGDLLDPSHLLQSLPPPDLGSRKTEYEMKARMTYVLSYVAAGLTLDMPEIHVHGVQIADRLLSWENIEPVLDLALNSPFQHTMAVQHILRTAVDFIVLNFPVHFTLVPTAPQLESLPRLIEQRQQQHNPGQQGDSESSLFPQGRRQSHHRLKSIRFGDAPSGQETPSLASILSSVLISLPFEILTNIFQSLALRDRLGSVLATQHMYAVVGEREKRRMGSIGAYNHAPDHAQNVDPTIMQNMGWEESVESSDQDAIGLRIVRRRVNDATVNGRH